MCPSVPPGRLDLGVEAGDEARHGQSRTDALCLLEGDGQVLAHPIDDETPADTALTTSW
jgi:hypothetical protein